MWELLFWGVLQGFVIGFIASKAFPTLKIAGPIIMWKSHRGLKTIGRIAEKHKRLWEAYGDFGLILAFGVLGALYAFRNVRGRRRWGLSLLASLFLLSPTISNIIIWLGTGSAGATTNSLFMGDWQSQLFFQAILLFFGFSLSLLYLIAQSAWGVLFGYLSGAAVQAAVAPALPGIAVKGSPFQIPWYGWLAFPIIIIVHELSHGILVKAQGLRLKATGLLMFGLVPLGAFIEPDEKQLKKAPAAKQMRVYSVGSAANYITSFAILGLFVLVATPLLGGYYAEYNSYQDHPQIGEVLSTSDGYGRLAAGAKIVSINGTNIPNIDALHAATAAAGPGAMLLMETSNGTYEVRLNNESMIGVTGLVDTFREMPLQTQAITWLISFTGLVVFFNFIVGVMNLLPMAPLDGGLLLESMVAVRSGRKTARHVAKYMTGFVLLLLLLNMLPLFFPAS